MPSVFARIRARHYFRRPGTAERGNSRLKAPLFFRCCRRVQPRFPESHFPMTNHSVTTVRVFFLVPLSMSVPDVRTWMERKCTRKFLVICSPARAIVLVKLELFYASREEYAIVWHFMVSMTLPVLFFTWDSIGTKPWIGCKIGKSSPFRNSIDASADLTAVGMESFFGFCFVPLCFYFCFRFLFSSSLPPAEVGGHSSMNGAEM